MEIIFLLAGGSCDNVDQSSSNVVNYIVPETPSLYGSGIIAGGSCDNVAQTSSNSSENRHDVEMVKSSDVSGIVAGNFSIYFCNQTRVAQNKQIIMFLAVFAIEVM